MSTSAPTLENPDDGDASLSSSEEEEEQQQHSRAAALPQAQKHQFLPSLRVMATARSPHPPSASIPSSSAAAAGAIVTTFFKKRVPPNSIAGAVAMIMELISFVRGYSSKGEGEGGTTMMSCEEYLARDFDEELRELLTKHLTTACVQASCHLFERPSSSTEDDPLSVG